MRQKAALTLIFLQAAAKQTAYVYEPPQAVSVRSKALPSACEIYCPSRSVCERCWRGRCDYEGQEHLCFGCAEASCFNDRILQGSSYKDAKQKATTAAFAVAAAAAMNQNDNLEGFSKASRAANQSQVKNKSLVIIQGDKASRVIMSDDPIDMAQLKGLSTKQTKKASQFLTYNPNIINLPPPTDVKKRFGHYPELTPPVGAIVDQRVWVPVPNIAEEEVRRNSLRKPETAVHTVLPTNTPSVVQQPVHAAAKIADVREVVSAPKEVVAPASREVHALQRREVLATAPQPAVPSQRVNAPVEPDIEPTAPLLEGSKAAPSSGDEAISAMNEIAEDELEATSEVDAEDADMKSNEVFPVAIASIANKNEAPPTLLRRGGLVANLLRQPPPRAEAK